MVRKVSAIVCSLVLICALCTTAQATTHEIYENSTISSTYTTIFSDIINNMGLNYNYVLFRSGQNSYTMVTGWGDRLKYNSSTRTFSLATSNLPCKEYMYYTDGTNYSSNYKYNVSDISNFELTVYDEIVYTNLSDEFPNLIDWGDVSVSIQTLLITFVILAYYISRIFSSGSRRKR